MRSILTIFLFSVLISSCSIFKKDVEEIDVSTKIQTELKDLTVNGKIKVDMPQQNATVNTQIKIAGRDSLFMKILGPFGIEVMRLYSSEDEFTLLNTFQNEAYKGIPSSENLKKVSNINLSFQDLIKISRSEIPGNSDQYKFSGKKENELKIFTSIKDGIRELIKIDLLGRIIEYKQFDVNGTETLMVNFKDYKNVEGFDLAHKIDIAFKEIGGSMTIEASELLINTIGNSPLSFSLPESVDIQVID